MDKKALSAQARKLVESGGVLLDVRSPAEFNAGHPDVARNIPVKELEHRVKELGDPSTAVVVYCASGVRSAAAEQILRRHGFSTVLNIVSAENF